MERFQTRVSSALSQRLTLKEFLVAAFKFFFQLHLAPVHVDAGESLGILAAKIRGSAEFNLRDTFPHPGGAKAAKARRMARLACLCCSGTLSLGGALQVEPITSTLKPPGMKLLRLKYDKLLSILLQFCFQIQLAPLHLGGGDRGVSANDALQTVRVTTNVVIIADYDISTFAL
jgi:hypothetical protein